MRLFPAVALCVLISAATHAQTLRGKVVGVSDGDTITVLVNREEVRVRLEAIDAPETGQPFGDRAKRVLSDAVFGKTVAVEVTGEDRYERKLGFVYIRRRGEPVSVNRAMVAAGMAWHYVAYSDDEELAEAEAEARKKRRGLWRDDDPMPPWEWRKRERAG
ncbi:MAG: thermonuclease family protein [Planctomycetota bacterium]